MRKTHKIIIVTTLLAAAATSLSLVYIFYKIATTSVEGLSDYDQDEIPGLYSPSLADLSSNGFSADIGGASSVRVKNE